MVDMGALFFPFSSPPGLLRRFQSAVAGEAIRRGSCTRKSSEYHFIGPTLERTGFYGAACAGLTEAGGVKIQCGDLLENTYLLILRYRAI